MTRRTLLKLLVLLPLVGPGIAKALAKSGLKPARRFTPYLPAEFPKWNRAVDGLEEAGSWVLKLERSRLPQNVLFPQVGQVWEAVRDCEVQFRADNNCEVHCRTHLNFYPPRLPVVGLPQGVVPVPGPVAVPAGGAGCKRPSPCQPSACARCPLLFPGGTAQLDQGERVRILELDGPPPIFVHFRPLRYEELHAHIVPEDIRKLPGYGGYVLSLKTAKTVSDLALANKKGRQSWFLENFKLALV
jgi:hypothetical protein